ncbi:MAG: citrate lyase holo-[acyl-carrier protein] synthase [Chordicoccus sp.]
MEGSCVELKDMLQCREQRAAEERELLDRYGVPLISFCMNIPGPVKTNAQIRRGFESGKHCLLEQLEEKGCPVISSRERHEMTGDELLLAVRSDAKLLKALTVSIEERHPLGRLFDLDVIGTDGKKLSRDTYRICLICGRQAQECARSRRHSVKELQDAVDALLRAWANSDISGS